MILRLVVFEWRIERFEDAFAMSPAALVSIYDEHQAHERWKEKAHRKG